jgi:hypothetical protein
VPPLAIFALPIPYESPSAALTDDPNKGRHPVYPEPRRACPEFSKGGNIATILDSALRGRD